MNCDYLLKNKKGQAIPEPLINRSGFLYIINGYSGSGKSTLMVNLLCRKNKNGNKRSYRGCFDTIIFVSPSSHTLNNKEIDDLEHKYTNFDEETIDLIEEITDNNVDDDKDTLLILDDVGAKIRSSKVIEARLSMLCNNRRHRRLSIMILSQQIYQNPPNIRKNANLIFTFKPKTKKEKDVIYEEFMEMNKNDYQDLLDFVFRDKRDFLIIDCSLRKTADIEYYRNFDKIVTEKN